MDLTNEPVAWINEPYAIEAGFDNGDGTYCVLIKRLPLRTETHKDWKPHEKLLYTHPKGFNWSDVNNEQLMNEVRSRGYIISNAQVSAHPVKELTDEEIINCAEMDFVREELTNKTPEYMWIMDFARSILRKASEK